MRAQVLEAFNTPYVLKDIPKPAEPTGQDILVQVQAASYCHTDAVFASGAMWQDLPRCYECRNNDGDPHKYGVWCSKAGNLGLSRDGGFQEYCIADSRQVAPMPDGMAAVDTAPLMCAGLTIWNALEAGRVELKRGGGEGRTVAISGAGGGLGHLGVQFAVKLGCNVVAIDASDSALAFLQQVVDSLGPLSSKVTIVDARRQKAEDVRIEACGQPENNLPGEKGVDALLVLPEAQQALTYGMKLIKDHGVCVTVSFPKDGFLIQPRDLVFRHIEMRGVLVGRNRQLRAMLNFAGEENVRAVITSYKLEDLNKLVEDTHHGATGKLVIDMSK
uniref:Enoyl reductase (ER) domain-containing protein n=1 Tax=Bionectria ochroleuca TaxID=29856 RepID=A0A0B7KIL4_BIOOC